MHIPLVSGGYSNIVFRHSCARYVYSEKEVENHPVTGKDRLSFGVEAHQTCDYKKDGVCTSKKIKRIVNMKTISTCKNGCLFFMRDRIQMQTSPLVCICAGSNPATRTSYLMIQKIIKERIDVT